MIEFHFFGIAQRGAAGPIEINSVSSSKLIHTSKLWLFVSIVAAGSAASL
jgi:hypothetical protein